jgi:hypothetical protein
MQRHPSVNRTWSVPGRVCAILCVMTLIVLLLPGASAAADAPSQCVHCHTDAAKLKALTPPDPPPTEEGEG